MRENAAIAAFAAEATAVVVVPANVAAITTGLTLCPASQFRVNSTNLPMAFSGPDLVVVFIFTATRLQRHHLSKAMPRHSPEAGLSQHYSN